MNEPQHPRQPEVLDAETKAALEDGIRMADMNSQRWSPEQVEEYAKRTAKEWRENIKKQASA